MEEAKEEGRNTATRFLLKFLIFILAFVLLTMGMQYGLQRLQKSSTHTGLQENGATPSTVHRIVILDAGHGGEDGGASSEDGILEKDLNLSVTFLIADLLRASGVTVILTRDSDRLLYDPTADYQGRKKVLDQRARIETVETAVRENPDAEVLFVSIHMNSYPASNVRGLQVWYSPNHADSAPLAELIQSGAARYVEDATVREIKQAGSNIFLLDRLTTPAILIECGFLSSPEEAARLASKAYQKRLAFAVTAAILNFESPIRSPEEARSATASFP